MRQTTKQSHIPAIVQAFHFSHIEPDETDAKKILTACPFDNWRRPPRCPPTTLMKTIQQELKSNNLSLNEAIDMTQNRPLWRLMSTFGAMHS